MPESPAQALRMEKSGRAENQDQREVTEMELPTLARRDFGEVIPEADLAEPAHVGLTKKLTGPACAEATNGAEEAGC